MILNNKRNEPVSVARSSRPQEIYPKIVEHLPKQSQPPPKQWLKFKRMITSLFVGIAVAAKAIIKLKLLIIPILKYGFIALKTGGSMIIFVAFYAVQWGWWFAFGFALLLLVHEFGHLIVARMLGLDVGAPVFIPFMGAFIALKDAPKNAWIEAQVGIGGPLLGTTGALVCWELYLFTNNKFFCTLAYTGFFLNLFNLLPLGFLDGGRVVTAISPWLWLLGFAAAVALLVFWNVNLILLLIVILSIPRLFSLFRKKSDDERRYFEVTAMQRFVITVTYFGLIAILVVGMDQSLVQLHQQQT